MNVAINGFGRIGRLVFKAGFDDVDFVAVNDIASVDNLAYLLKYDSVFGKYDKKVEVKKDKLIVDNKEIKVLSEKEPSNLPWKDFDIDVVVESTGIFLTHKLASEHLEAGAKKVLLSAPAKSKDIKTIVYGVNNDTYDKGKDNIISNASCTTNSLAPMAYILNNNFGIENGFITTVHAYTSSQNIVDGPHKKLARGRAAASNIVPTTTGAAEAVGKVIPELNGKLDGMALRVPIPNGSITDLVCNLKKEVDTKEINKTMKKASKNNMKGIIEYSEDELVSSDIIGNSHSVVINSASTNAIGKTAKVLGWYDNEWGFSCRMIDVIKMML